jgi:hypothetical protein
MPERSPTLATALEDWLTVRLALTVHTIVGFTHRRLRTQVTVPPRCSAAA